MSWTAGEPADAVAQAAVAWGRSAPLARPVRPVSSPLLAALRAAGTRHVYADTADAGEIAALGRGPDEVPAELDGNTANQPLVEKMVARALAPADLSGWPGRLATLPAQERMPLLYTMLCGRLGSGMLRRIAGGRPWDTSLQLHMGLCGHEEAALRAGRLLGRMVPGVRVKVPFTPDQPGCLLVARELQREGLAVNLTSTFSARQVVVGALFAGVSLTNIFMGRLNQGLQARALGEHVDLEAQRALLELRRRHGVETQLIVASLRDWRTFPRVAGCDAFTAPCSVLRDFLAQEEFGPDDLASSLEDSYADELGVAPAVRAALPQGAIERLWRVEPELVEFLLQERRAPPARDGDELFRRFEAAGFADLFHVPTSADASELAMDKLPQLGGTLRHRVALDTHFSLLANADFVRHQAKIDEALADLLERAGRGAARGAGHAEAPGTAAAPEAAS